MEQKKRTGEIESAQKFSVGNPERKRHFGGSRHRQTVKDNAINKI